MPTAARVAPRKRARQARSRATVEAILTATARLLVREGYERASTNRVAEAAGVSVGSLYQYYPNKEALVSALIDRHCEQMIAVLSASFADAAGAPLPAVVRALVRAQIEAHKVDPALHKVLIEQVPRVGPLDRLASVERRATELVRGYLELYRREVRVARLDLAAFIVVHAVEAVTHAAVLEHPEHLADEGLVDEVTDLVVRYLAGEAPPPVPPRYAS